MGAERDPLLPEFIATSMRGQKVLRQHPTKFKIQARGWQVVYICRLPIDQILTRIAKSSSSQMVGWAMNQNRRCNHRPNETGLGKYFCPTESFGADSDHVANQEKYFCATEPSGADNDDVPCRSSSWSPETTPSELHQRFAVDTFVEHHGTQ